MGQLRFIWVILIMLASIVVASVSYRYGLHAQQTAENRRENRSVAYAQAVLAFAHYKTNDHIESFLLRKCYEAALTVTREEKILQLTLLSENLHATENDPELVEYIKIRDPKLLETILAGRLPELKKSYKTTCP